MKRLTDMNANLECPWNTACEIQKETIEPGLCASYQDRLLELMAVVLLIGLLGFFIEAAARMAYRRVVHS